MTTFSLSNIPELPAIIGFPLYVIQERETFKDLELVKIDAELTIQQDENNVNFIYRQQKHTFVTKAPVFTATLDSTLEVLTITRVSYVTDYYYRTNRPKIVADEESIRQAKQGLFNGMTLWEQARDTDFVDVKEYAVVDIVLPIDFDINTPTASELAWLVAEKNKRRAQGEVIPDNPDSWALNEVRPLDPSIVVTLPIGVLANYDSTDLTVEKVVTNTFESWDLGAITPQMSRSFILAESRLPRPPAPSVYEQRKALYVEYVPNVEVV